jgi:hypothetical protein
MLDTGERAGVEERYSTAGNTSDLSVEADKGNSADVIIAAGWSDSRIGMALLRLHSEWNGCAKPKRSTRAMIEARASAIRDEDAQAKANRAKANGELDRLRKLQAKEPTFDRAVEIMEQESLYQRKTLPMPEPRFGNPVERAQTEADHWYVNELRLLANGLKGRAVVWQQLAPWIALKGIDPEVAAEGLLHWLDPTCQRCGGHGLLKSPDAPTLSAKRCGKCYGRGEVAIPHGAGKMVDHLNACVGLARRSLKDRLRPQG